MPQTPLAQKNHQAPKIAMIDHYDSFTYNLVYYLHALSCSVDVFAYDTCTLSMLLPYSHIIIAPGFGHPKDAKGSLEAIRHYAPTKKILGVCLGHQCIGVVFGGEIARLTEPMHGKSSVIDLLPCPLFAGLGDRLEVGRYHSLYVASLGEELVPLAFDSAGIVMALKHRDHDVYGVQFHPESVLSRGGMELLANFLRL
ncbi:hypothetical protein BKH46_06350 [Helicobacter sp. 12S02634-8]|uniref:anthranilate synthase component II n=1 Tax=Helicobacter sp. 12S02634-8 TaxID=1476199 RepID=UPI000BA7CEF7|nr:aminodeoxychorismate/anthranilate synthase component II [Helicobacter sp. 12S02634-8]PAF46831.1 hypothetical protein BKH46_06350 [Helicobacter sp. 12S02634-8]